MSGLAALLMVWCSAVAVAATPSLPDLVTLRGDNVEMRYSPGALDRAARAQVRFELLAALLADLCDRRVPLSVWVVEPDDWRRGGFTRPFGFPETVGDFGVALPAWGDDRSVALWRGLLGGELPAPAGSFVRGTPEESAALDLADVVALVDAARVLFATCGYRADTPWAQEVAVHAAVRLSTMTATPERLGLFDELFARYVARGGGDGARSLSEWSVGAAPRERLWYEGEFARGAALLVAAEGPRGTKRLLRKGLEKGRAAAGTTLEEKAPELVDWRRGAFAP